MTSQVLGNEARNGRERLIAMRPGRGKARPRRPATPDLAAKVLIFNNFLLTTGLRTFSGSAATDDEDVSPTSAKGENPMFRKTILGLAAGAALVTAALAPTAASAHYYGGYGYYGYKSYYKPYYGYRYYKPYYGYRSYYRYY
jgi:hypothetical protein